MTLRPDLPLTGLVVVELGTSVAAPTGAMVLGELGAEVIKVEPPGSGDDARLWGPPFAHGASTVFNALNRNKRSVRVGPSLVDQGAGLWSVIGILAALRRRDVTGEGCEVGTSLYETALGWMGMHLSSFLETRRPPQKIGTENGGIAPYKAYRAADDRWLVIAAGNDTLFRRLATALGQPAWPEDPRFATNPDRVRNRAAINEAVAAVVATQPRPVWLSRLDAAGVPCAPVLGLDEVVADPQFQALGMLQQPPDGGPALLGLPLRFDGARPPFRRSPPALGEATDALLRREPAAP
jgi:crotonobetainyl-CoA:carnitine CoA-transferase CaiB-like acyl-CoA transferase